jgi:muconolactone delta-isomerase
MYRQRLWPRCGRYAESSVSDNDEYDRLETVNKLVSRSDTHAENKK